jgi:hypothetical protein
VWCGVTRSVGSWDIFFFSCLMLPLLLLYMRTLRGKTYVRDDRDRQMDRQGKRRRSSRPGDHLCSSRVPVTVYGICTHLGMGCNWLSSCSRLFHPITISGQLLEEEE